MCLMLEKKLVDNKPLNITSKGPKNLYSAQWRIAGLHFFSRKTLKHLKKKRSDTKSEVFFIQQFFYHHSL